MSTQNRSSLQNFLLQRQSMKALKSLTTEVKFGVIGTIYNFSLLQSNAEFQLVEIIPL